MLFWYFLVIFLPIGIFVLLNPYGWASGYREALVRSGLPTSVVTAIAAGWALVGVAALIIVINSAISGG